MAMIVSLAEVLLMVHTVYEVGSLHLLLPYSAMKKLVELN